MLEKIRLEVQIGFKGRSTYDVTPLGFMKSCKFEVFSKKPRVLGRFRNIAAIMADNY